MKSTNDEKSSANMIERQASLKPGEAGRRVGGTLAVRVELDGNGVHVRSNIIISNNMAGLTWLKPGYT